MRIFLVLLFLAATVQPCNAQTLGQRNKNNWHNGPDNWMVNSGNSGASDSQNDLARQNDIFNESRGNEDAGKSLMAPAGRGGFLRESSEPRPRQRKMIE